MMESFPATNKEPSLPKPAKILAFLLGASLCVNDIASTICMLLIALGFVVIQIRNKHIFNVNYRYLWIPGALLLIRVFGLFTGMLGKAGDELVRSIPLLVLPLLFMWAAKKWSNSSLLKHLFWGIVFGLFFVAAICFGNVIWQIIENDQPWGYFWRWRYLNFNFTRPFDLHPAYLGLFIVMVATFTVFTKVVHKRYRMPILIGLGVFLFQLAARNAIIITGILGLIYVTRNASKGVKALTSVAILGILGIVLFQPSDYLRNRFFSIFYEDTEVMEDNRFIRLEASYNVFKMAPVFGVGPGYDNEFRKLEYLRLGEQVAYDKNYNAHNQFAEYLSTYGLVGLLIFLSVLFILLRYCYSKRMWLLFFLLCAFIFSMITESMLERSMGIKYFSQLIGFIFYGLTSQQNFFDLFNGRGAQRDHPDRHSA